MKYTAQAPQKNIFHTLFFALFLSLVLSGCAATVTRGANGALKWEQCTPILSGERAGVSVRCSTNGQKHEKKLMEEIGKKLPDDQARDLLDNYQQELGVMDVDSGGKWSAAWCSLAPTGTRPGRWTHECDRARHRRPRCIG